MADVAWGLATDQAYGLVALRLVVLGRARFKSGPFRSGWHSLRVRCDVLVGLNAGPCGVEQFFVVLIKNWEAKIVY
ncbi:hypothetical protein ZIOFF_022941 [Zingiber officinale]|uniref:Uncharacterized protein n=1 Tax=Zingiber officinale TaxID=94328 RepID=A0A8J5HDH4_ZINOF|nr:hypothetical protein ZIOFF_022941 [Zingiber officinale]